MVFVRLNTVIRFIILAVLCTLKLGAASTKDSSKEKKMKTIKDSIVIGFLNYYGYIVPIRAVRSRNCTGSSYSNLYIYV